MKNFCLIICFSLFALMTGVTVPAYAQINLSGNWSGVFTNNYSHSGDLSCSVYQLNNTIHGSLYSDGESATFSGQITTGWDSLYVVVTNSDGEHTYGQCAITADSISFTYFIDNTTTSGSGFILRDGPTRTLIVNYNYTGAKEVSLEIPLGVEVYDNPDILGGEPLMRIEYSSSSGVAYIGGMTSDTVYCMLYAGYSDSLVFFESIELAYALYGNTETMKCDTIVIKEGEVVTITVNFDDTYLYPMEAQFPGGKLDVADTVGLPFQPNTIACDPDGNIYITDISYNVYKYNQYVGQPYSLNDDTNNPIRAGVIKFAPDSSFYVLYSSQLIHYSPARRYLGSVGVGYSWVDLAVGSDGSVYCASDTEIVRYNPSLSEAEVSLTLSQIQNDYPPISTSCTIRSVAVGPDGTVAVSVDVEPDEEGRDLVLFYPGDLSRFDRAIWEAWEFNYPCNMEFDSDENLYVLNHWHDNLIVFDSLDQRYQASYWVDEPGVSNGAMDGPRDLTISKGKIYVVERPNNRVSVFRLKGAINQNLNLSGITTGNEAIYCFNAYDTISVGGDERLPVIFESGSDITLIAGKLIRLLPGFYAEEGCILDARITTDNSFCDTEQSSPVFNVKLTDKSEKLNPEILKPVNASKSLRIYPNPNDGQFVIEMSPMSDEVAVLIYNMMGEKVYQLTAHDMNDDRLSLSGLKKGIYIVKFIDGDRGQTAKILVE